MECNATQTQTIIPDSLTQALTVGGTINGEVFVANAFGFKVGAMVTVQGTALPTLRLQIVAVDLTTTPHTITLSDGDGVAPDLTGYTVVANSSIIQLQEGVGYPYIQVDIAAQSTPLVVSVVGGVTVTGGLTDAELRATPVDVVGPLTDAELRATAVPVSGTVTVDSASLADLGFAYNMPTRLGVIVSPSASRNNGTTVATFALTDKVQLLPDVAIYVKFGIDNTVAATSANYDDIVQGGERYPCDMKSTYTHVACLAVVTGIANTVVSSLEA